jgi:hypothetical protein
MPRYYCVDYGSETSPDVTCPFRNTDPNMKHVLLVNSDDELIFYGLNSCLGILLLLSNGQRISGHIVQLDPRDYSRDAKANAHTVLNEMLKIKPAKAEVVKAVFLFNSNEWGFKTLMGKLGNPTYLGISYSAVPTNKIDATVQDTRIVAIERQEPQKTWSHWTKTSWLTEVGGINFQ